MQYCRKRCFDVGDAACRTQVFQVFNSEYLAHGMTQTIQKRRGFFQCKALFPAIHSTHDQQPFAERRAQRVDQQDRPRRELLAQFFRSHGCGGK